MRFRSGTAADYMQLASFNLGTLGCVKQVKQGGPGVKAGGKTPFCDITEGSRSTWIRPETA